MKYYLALLILMCNVCYGQDKENVGLLERLTNGRDSFQLSMESLPFGETDSVVINNDTAYYWIHENKRAFIFYKEPLLGWHQITSGTTAEVKNPKGVTLNTETFTSTPTIDTTSAIIYSRQVKAKRDTIPVILMVTNKNYFTAQNGSDGKVIHPVLYKHEVYSIDGYSVREKHEWIDKEIYRPTGPYYWKHLYYLDQNKKKLSENILIWQSK